MKNTAAWMWGGIGAIVVVGAIWWAIAASPAALKKPTTVADPTLLPGMTTSAIPEGASTWGPEVENLEARLAADNMAPQTMEGQVLHIHQHLDLIIHGRPVMIPAQIGINERAGWLTAIHTHTADGLIHVESPILADYTLGQLFDVWGVAFTQKCIAGYCAENTPDNPTSLRVYVNGVRYEEDPRYLVLKDHQQISIFFGPSSINRQPVQDNAPASYSFPQGL